MSTTERLSTNCGKPENLAVDPRERPALPDAGDSTGVASRSQFSLRALFILVTYFALASALALRWGIGVFVLMLGICLTWLSRRGYLGKWQTKRTRPKVFAGAWLLFGISLASPALVVQGCNNTRSTVYGWQCALAGTGAVGQVAEHSTQLIAHRESRTWEAATELATDVLGAFVLNLPNAMMLASPLLLYRLNRGRGEFLSGCQSAAAACSWSWGLQLGKDASDLLAGYYIWSTAITIIGLLRPPGGKTLVAMTLVASLILLLSYLSN